MSLRPLPVVFPDRARVKFPRAGHGVTAPSASGVPGPGRAHGADTTFKGKAFSRSSVSIARWPQTLFEGYSVITQIPTDTKKVVWCKLDSVNSDGQRRLSLPERHCRAEGGEGVSGPVAV